MHINRMLHTIIYLRVFVDVVAAAATDDGRRGALCMCASTFSFLSIIRMQYSLFYSK